MFYVEHTLFDLACPTDEFRIPLIFSLFTKGYSQSGVRYKVHGTRCSGDAHTSIGNAFINSFLTFVALRDLHPDKYSFLVEGDDGVVAVDENVENFESRFAIIGLFGFNIKLNILKTLSDVTFIGQYLTSDQPYSDFFRTISKFHTTLSVGEPNQLLLAKAISYGYMNPSTPILSIICKNIIRLSEVKISRRTLKRELFKSHNIRIYFQDNINVQAVLNGINFTEPSAVMRAAFASRTRLSPGFQVAYENWWNNLKHLPSTIPKFNEEIHLSNDSQLFCKTDEMWL